MFGAQQVEHRLEYRLLRTAVPHHDASHRRIELSQLGSVCRRHSVEDAAGDRHNRLAAVDLDGFFGLHPSLSAFKPIYDEGRLAVVHAVGSPDNTRSHFDAQDYMESATPGMKSTSDGWLNRLLGEERETIEEVVEPYLVRAGLLARTPRGRIATAAAWEHLGLATPAAISTTASLFDSP